MDEGETLVQFYQLKTDLYETIEEISTLTNENFGKKTLLKKDYISLLDLMRETIAAARVAVGFLKIIFKVERMEGSEEVPTAEQAPEPENLQHIDQNFVSAVEVSPKNILELASDRALEAFEDSSREPSLLEASHAEPSLLPKTPDSRNVSIRRKKKKYLGTSVEDSLENIENEALGFLQSEEFYAARSSIDKEIMTFSDVCRLNVSIFDPAELDKDIPQWADWRDTSVKEDESNVCEMSFPESSTPAPAVDWSREDSGVETPSFAIRNFVLRDSVISPRLTEVDEDKEEDATDALTPVKYNKDKKEIDQKESPKLLVLIDTRFSEQSRQSSPETDSQNAESADLPVTPSDAGKGIDSSEETKEMKEIKEAAAIDHKETTVKSEESDSVEVKSRELIKSDVEEATDQVAREVEDESVGFKEQSADTIVSLEIDKQKIQPDYLTKNSDLSDSLDLKVSNSETQSEVTTETSQTTVPEESTVLRITPSDIKDRLGEETSEQFVEPESIRATDHRSSVKSILKTNLGQPGKSLVFHDVTFFYFARRQGWNGVPKEGGNTLGMDYCHRYSENFPLEEEAVKCETRETKDDCERSPSTELETAASRCELYPSSKVQQNCIALFNTSEQSSLLNNSYELKRPSKMARLSSPESTCWTSSVKEPGILKLTRLVESDRSGSQWESANQILNWSTCSEPDKGRSRKGRSSRRTKNCSIETSTPAPRKGECGTRGLFPLSSRARKSLLKGEGVKDLDPEEGAQIKNIRQSRKFCGCTCNTACNPGSCECVDAGIQCQEERFGFPCACSGSCSNPNGIKRFDPSLVKMHYIQTMLDVQGALDIK